MRSGWVVRGAHDSEILAFNFAGDGVMSVLFEKKTVNLCVLCKPSEKAAWIEAFGWGEVSRVARALLNEAAKKALHKRGSGIMMKSG